MTDLHKCNKCGANASSRCSKCREVWYCTREHQVSDWPAHKAQCAKSRQQQQQPQVAASNLPDPHGPSSPSQPATTTSATQETAAAKGEPTATSATATTNTAAATVSSAASSASAASGASATAEPAHKHPTLEELCGKVIASFEQVDESLHDTCFAAAEFPADSPTFSVTAVRNPQSVGGGGARKRDLNVVRNKVKSAGDWVSTPPGGGMVQSDDVLRAYWVMRANKNSTALSVVLLETVQKVGKVIYKDMVLKSEWCHMVRLGVEPPKIGHLDISGAKSTIPANTSRDYLHTWVEFDIPSSAISTATTTETTSTSTESTPNKTPEPQSIVVDLALPQFDLWPAGMCNPIAILPADKHLGLFKRHRELSKREAKLSSASFSSCADQVSQCLGLLFSRH
ncbi:hypothetical protein Pelo_11809 [Pelomyxa schiedti]|nr:hypothetical protein Pelo_11809 [Pelomyxa schiedti]